MSQTIINFGPSLYQAGPWTGPPPDHQVTVPHEGVLPTINLGVDAYLLAGSEVATLKSHRDGRQFLHVRLDFKTTDSLEFERSILLLWIEGRSQWVAISYSQWLESGTSKDDSYSTPYLLDDFCRFQVQRALGIVLSDAPPPPEKPAATLAGHVFLSYVNADRPTVSNLADSLRDRGYTVWLDKDALLPGEEWNLAIRRAIREGVAFVACFSSQYWKRPTNNMNEELHCALEEMRRMPDDKLWFIPLKLDTCEIPAFQIRPGRDLSSKHWISLTEDWSAGVDRIAKALEALRLQQLARSET